MKLRERLAEVPPERLPAGEPVFSSVPGPLSAREILAIRERAERLYRMGELAAAAELLIQPGVQ